MTIDFEDSKEPVITFNAGESVAGVMIRNPFMLTVNDMQAFANGTIQYFRERPAHKGKTLPFIGAGHVAIRDEIGD